jgi:hypothetical protein
MVPVIVPPSGQARPDMLICPRLAAFIIPAVFAWMNPALLI